MEPVTVNFAMTRDDCMHSRVAQMKMQLPKTHDFTVRFLSIDLIILSCVLLVISNLYHRPLQWLCAVFVAIGVFLMFLYKPLQEAFASKAAANDFDSGRSGPPAHIVSFREDCVEFGTERYQAKIPYRMLYSVYEDETVFLLCTAIDEFRSVPIRAMTGAEQKRVESLLADHLKQKFKQEGAREWTK